MWITLRPNTSTIACNKYNGSWSKSWSLAWILWQRVLWLSRDSYMYRNYRANTNRIADNYLKAKVRRGRMQRDMTAATFALFSRRSESIMRLWWRQRTCGCYREIHGTGCFWEEQCHTLMTSENLRLLPRDSWHRLFLRGTVSHSDDVREPATATARFMAKVVFERNSVTLWWRQRTCDCYRKIRGTGCFWEEQCDTLMTSENLRLLPRDSWHGLFLRGTVSHSDDVREPATATARFVAKVVFERNSVALWWRQRTCDCYRKIRGKGCFWEEQCDRAPNI
jgi:uncharacterized protein (DUF427 family)